MRQFSDECEEKKQETTITRVFFGGGGIVFPLSENESLKSYVQLKP